MYKVQSLVALGTIPQSERFPVSADRTIILGIPTAGGVFHYHGGWDVDLSRLLQSNDHPRSQYPDISSLIHRPRYSKHPGFRACRSSLDL